MINLDEHFSGVAERFLQTALVIDDQAQFGPVTLVGPVGTVIAPAKGVLDAAARGEVNPHPNLTVAIETPAEPPVASLDAKTLSEAFLARKMICGLYKPSAGENMVEKTIGVAQAADVVVVDWNLVQGSSSQAKDIVLGLLAADKAEKGRLRLIAIYTSQPGREAIASELLASIEEHAQLKGVLQQKGPVLCSADTRIVVLNKTRTPEAADREEVPEEALPARLVAEFAQLSHGVLASFALSSVGAIRRGAHHVLALYTSEIDGAYIAHRCEIPHPDDSKTFALDLITSELRNLIELDGVAEETLGSPVIEAWVENKIQSGHKFKNSNTEIPADEVRNFAAGGAEAVKNSKPVQHVPDNPQTVSEQKIKPGTLARTFYPTADSAKAGVRRLSRLSTFQRETTRTRLPEGWLPKLTLGSVIRRATADGSGEMLLCVQPRCDSIRLGEKTAFPFQTISTTGSGFNLVLPREDGEEIEVWVNLKPRDTRMIEFNPDTNHRSVLASRNSETGDFAFKDAYDVLYTWIGDLKAMKAQRWVGELGSRVQAIGMEELEWLRLASEEKIKQNWAG